MPIVLIKTARINSSRSATATYLYNVLLFSFLARPDIGLLSTLVFEDATMAAPGVLCKCSQE